MSVLLPLVSGAIFLAASMLYDCDAFVLPNRVVHSHLRSRLRDDDGHCSPRSLLLQAKASSESINEDDDDHKNDEDDYDKIDLAKVSDEETLLACRTYLQHSNRLKEHSAAERKEAIAQWQKRLDEGDPKMGFFWENVYELKCYARPYNAFEDYDSDDVEEATDHHEPEEEAEEEETEWDDPEQRRSVLEKLKEYDLGPNIAFAFPDDDDEPRDDEYLPGYHPFVGKPKGKSLQSQRYSDARYRMWAEEGFRERWYKKRYPNGRADPAKLKVDQKLRSLPQDVLDSPELLSLTEEEIKKAVFTYRRSNDKRSTQRRKLNDESDDDWDRNLYVDDPCISPENDSQPFALTSDLFNLDSEALKERRRKRGEEAKKYYRTRVENQKRRGRAPSREDASLPADLPQGKTPIDALTRVSEALDHHILPSTDDIRLIMKPAKLGKRKALLRRLLDDHFDARGRCIPPIGNEGVINNTTAEDELIYVTLAPLDAVAAYAINLIEERQKMQQEPEKTSEGPPKLG